MTSNSLREWRTERAQELSRARALVTRGSADQDLHLGTYLRVLCSEFQAYCARLHGEAAGAVRSALPRQTSVALRDLLYEALTSRTRLAQGNPTLGNLVRDFDRLTIDLRPAVLAATGPATLSDCQVLDRELIPARNELLHGNARLPGIRPAGRARLDRATLDDWAHALDRLATTMDNVVNTGLRRQFDVLLTEGSPR